MAGNDSKTIWLVRSGERILGPFTPDEIVSRVRSKETVVIDEVIAPGGRWRYVRDEPTFSGVVDEIRKGLLSAREDTEVQTISGDTTRKTADLLQGTEEPLQIVDAEIISETRNVSQPVATTASASRLTPTHVLRIKRMTRLLWLFAAILLLGIAGTIWVTHFDGLSTSQEVTREWKGWQEEAERAWRNGEFERAHKLYDKCILSNPKDRRSQIRKAALLMYSSGQSVAARRLLDAAAESGLGRELKAEHALVEALVMFDAGDLAGARAALEGIDIEGQTSEFADIVRFNLGIVSTKQGNLKEAVQKLRQTATAKRYSGLATLAQFVVLSEASDWISSFDFRQKVSELVEDRDRFSWDFQFEIAVVLAALELRAGSKERAMQQVSYALTLDPFISADHFRDPRLFAKLIGWDELIGFCEEVQKSADTGIEGNSIRALWALCLWQNGKRRDAESVIGKALEEHPTDSLINGVRALLLYSDGRGQEAQPALVLSEAGGGESLGQVVKARLCQAANPPCAMSVWETLQGPNNLMAMTGLVRLYEASGQTDKAKRIRDRVANRSPHFIPLFQDSPPQLSREKPKQ